MRNILETVINPALEMLYPYGIPITDNAKVILLAVGLRESALEHRRQLVGNPPKPTGPATGLWQFERGGAVVGVLLHPRSTKAATIISRERTGAASSEIVWEALQHDDILACVFARLLLWTDPLPLPDERQAAWDCYIRNWRPGKPKPDAWAANWNAAINLIKYRQPKES